MSYLSSLTKRLALVLLMASCWAITAHATVTCTTGATSVMFGTYNPLNVGPLDSTGIVSVTCTLIPSPNAAKVTYTVALSAGASGSMLARRMQALPNQLNYNLHTTSAYSQIWGDGSGGTSIVNNSMKLGASGSGWTATTAHTIYGRIPASQDISPGNYSDTIIVTVTY